jgi:HTH-type transcriptional regulator, sugar sensing transcriptional regulator
MENYEKYQDILESIGLNKSEAIVYLDLLKSGGSSVVDISKRIGIHRSNIYDSLKRMSDKGLISENLNDKSKHFQCVEPKNLLQYYNQKEYDLKEILPPLYEIYKIKTQKRKLTVIEGIQSVRNILTDFIEDQNSLSIYGIPKIAYETLGPGFIEDFHKKRARLKVDARYIYSEPVIDRIKKLNQYKYTEARLLKSQFESIMSTHISGNCVLLLFWDSPISSILINNESIAKTYQNYFEVLWKASKKFY